MCQKRNAVRRTLLLTDVPSTLPYEKEVRLDECISQEVSDVEFTPMGSCCGHGRYKKTIVVWTPEGIMEYFSKVMIPRKRNFYLKDTEGYYYIPEVELHARNR